MIQRLAAVEENGRFLLGIYFLWLRLFLVHSICQDHIRLAELGHRYHKCSL